MKQITCEMCGSTSLVKNGGVFVCQACGCQYSVDEIKKMMIEGTVDVQGTVKVDNSAFVEKYLANARRAYAKEDWEEVEKYYNMVEQNDPTNIEAIFYSAYGKAKRSLVESDIYKREAAFKVLQNCVSVIDDNYRFEDDGQLEIIERISADIINMACSGYVYNQTRNGYGVVSSDKYLTMTLFNNLGLAFAESLDHIVSGYGDDTEKKLKLLKLALKHTEYILKNGKLRAPAQMKAKVDNYRSRICALDPSFSEVAANNNSSSLGDLAAKLAELTTSPARGKVFSILMIIYSIFPIVGSIMSGVFLHQSKKGTYTNINNTIAITTLVINIVVSIALPIILILTL